MNKKDKLLKTFSQILEYLGFKLKKYQKVYTARNQIYLEQVINKYISNRFHIIKPFKKSLPLQKFKGNPILKEGNSGEWDEAGIFEPFIIYNGQKYLLYYESETKHKGKDWQIGLATAEKITGPWKKYSNNPILRYTNMDGDFDKVAIADPCVIYKDGKYQMWFDMNDGKIWRIGKAYSTDGITWKKYNKDDKTIAILDIGKNGEWDDEFIHCPEVFIWNNRFHILYGAKGKGHIDYDTGLALQIDEKGEIFQKWGQVTSDFMFNKIGITSRLQAGIIVNGIIITGLRIKISNKQETTYMVFSDDGGKSWNILSNPILNPGKKGEWDEFLYYGPNCWINIGGLLWCGFLGGLANGPRRLGLAYMKFPKFT